MLYLFLKKNGGALPYILMHFLQYFLNPKVPKEPVPPQLELVSKEILVPLLGVFHQFVGKVYISFFALLAISHEIHF